jgi:hypothetical protein
MRCFDERSIDSAAICLADLGFSGDITSILSRDVAIPFAFAPIVAHAGRCFRCAELLELFLETELLSRQPARCLAADSAQGPAYESEMVLPLRRARSTTGTLDPPEDAREREDYDLAADSAPPVDPEDVLGNTWVLTLSTDDGRYVVRVFPQEGGRGAVAVLIRAADPESPAEQSGDGDAGGGGSCLFLRIGNRDLPFDEKGMLTLPEFPAKDIALIIRTTGG